MDGRLAAEVLERVCESSDEGDLLIELTDDQQSSITGEPGRGGFQNDWLPGKNPSWRRRLTSSGR